MEFKILQLNAWTGRIKDGLTRFIVEGNYDAVCLQEAIWDDKNTGILETYLDTVEKIKENAGFKYDFRSPIYSFEMLGGDTRFIQGNIILSKIPFTTTEEKTVCGECKNAKSAEDFKTVFDGHRCVVQKATLKNGLTIFNYHGYWEKDPLGSETTVKYMKIVAEMIKNTPDPSVLCGDLNIIAASPAMRELDFMQDLTAINKVKTTLKNIRFKKDVPCDHILITNDISCKYFNILEDIVSDHKPLEASLYL